MMMSHRLESPFFSKSKKLVIYITEATWLDKSMERVLVDLVNERADILPEGVAIDHAVKTQDGWKLGFSGIQKEENHSYQLFDQDYYDKDGNLYTYNRWSTGRTNYEGKDGKHIETPGIFHVEYELDGYQDDIVYLKPSFSRTSALAHPVEIRVK
jgi:hypothetical protein